MKKSILLFFTLVCVSAIYSQTRRLGTDTLILALESIQKYQGDIYSNANPRYCVQLDASSSVDPSNPDLKYIWLFDGFVEKEGLVVEQCFSSPGFHQAELSVMDTIINQLISRDTVLPLSLPNAMRFKIGGFQKILNTVTFDAFEYDLDDTFLFWDFGNGNYTAGQFVKNVYTDEGNYEVKSYEMKLTDGLIEIKQAVKDTVSIQNNRY